MGASTILVLDDGQHSLEGLTSALEDAGYAAIGITENDDPIGQFEALTPELVFLSLRADGALEICEAIRLTGHGAIVPIIFVGNGHAKVRSASEALTFGGDYHFGEPLELGKILAKVQTYVGAPPTVHDEITHVDVGQVVDLARLAGGGASLDVRSPASSSSDLASASDDLLAQIEAESRAEAERQTREQARRRADEEAERFLAEEAQRQADLELAELTAEADERRAAEEKRRAEEARKAAEAERAQVEIRMRAEQAAAEKKRSEEEARRRAVQEAEQLLEESRREAEERARREAEEQARREAEEQARREAEEQARREAEEQARREAEEQARREAEEQARREAEEQARREAEEQARREAEEQARREAEEQARREAEEQARREAEERARREAEERARREAEEQARREAEEQARREAEEQARREAEERTRREAEEQARREAEEQARREAEEQARREAEERTRREAEEQARREAEERTRREAEEQARREAEERARREAEEQARREEEERARREAELKARRDLEERMRREAEEEARRLEAQRAAEEARRQEEVRRRLEEEEARRRAEAEALRLAEEEIRQQRLAEEARRKAEEEAKRRIEEERRRVEAEAKRRAEEAEAEARRLAEEARRKLEEELARAEAERRAAEEARERAAEELRRRSEEAARRKFGSPTSAAPRTEPAHESGLTIAATLMPLSGAKSTELQPPSAIEDMEPRPVPPAPAMETPQSPEAAPSLAQSLVASMSATPARARPHLRAFTPEEGTFSASADMADLLAEAYRQQVTGRIDFTSGTRQKSVVFERGQPVDAYSSQVYDRMEEYLAREGRITKVQYQEVRVKGLRGPRRIGAFLVNEGYLRPDELFTAVRGHLEELVYSLFEWDEASYAYVAEHVDDDDRVTLEKDARAIVTEGIRRKYLLPRAVQKLGSPSSLLTRTDPEGRIDADALGLTADERQIARLVDGNRNIDDIVFSSGLGALRVYHVLAALCATGYAEVAVRGIEGLNLNGATDLDGIDRQRILERVEQVRQADYFQILGVSRGATTYEVEVAFERITRELAPPRLSPAIRGALKNEIDEIERVLEDARDVLRDQRMRESYARNLPRL